MISLGLSVSLGMKENGSTLRKGRRVGTYLAGGWIDGYHQDGQFLPPPLEGRLACFLACI